MQAREKYYDRRSNERRSDVRRTSTRRRNVRRKDIRLNSSFEISLLDLNGKTVNVSASGVYFEVATDDIGVFPLGKTVPLQMRVATQAQEGGERNIKISGKGKVVRNCKIENQDHAKRVGVALEFTEKLYTEPDYD